MLTLEQAKKIIAERLENYNFSINDSLIILDQYTIEKPYAWIFSYTSKLYNETKGIQYAIAGNSPIIIDKRTGKQTQYSSAYNLEETIELYEEEENIWNLVLKGNNIYDNGRLLLLKNKFNLSNDKLIQLKRNTMFSFEKGSKLRLTKLKKDLLEIGIETELKLS